MYSGKLNKKNIALVAVVFVVCLFFLTDVSASTLDLKQLDAGEDWITVSGYALDNSYGYVFQCSTDSGRNWSYLSKTTNKISKVLTGFENGKNYIIRVGSCATLADYINCNVSIWSKSYRVATMPDIVTGLKETDATSNSVTVQWDVASGANLYEIFYKETGDINYVSIGKTSDTTMVINGLKPITTYYVRVVPFSQNGDVQIANTHTPMTIEVYTISNVKNKISLTYWDTNTHKVVVNWNLGNGNTSGYEVEVSNIKNKKKIKTYDASSWYGSYQFNDKQVRNKGCYVRIRAYHVFDGKKVYEPWSKYTKLIPPAELKLSGQKGSKKVKLSWKKVSGAKSYSIYKQEYGSKLKKIKTVKKTTYTDNKLKYNKTTHYFVVANTKYGNTSINTTLITDWIYVTSSYKSTGVGWTNK